MMANAPQVRLEPVYQGYFADPFVLAHDGEYIAYGTGPTGNGRAFPMLRSSDFERWTEAGGALVRPVVGPDVAYWAPEVARCGDTWYMYYSVGRGDVGHALRVATADTPTGPMRDLGLTLTPGEPFAIDPHPFRDRDGSWYLFYAKDFLDGDRVGTALAVDRLIGMTALEGQPRTVLRASADWQIFERGRRKYGRTVDWHTLEGPFVVERRGVYYCFYSGGNWQNDTYGVSYAVADHPLGPWREPEGDGPALLGSIPGRLLGPGHNSLITGPEGVDRLVFHAWDDERSARRMHIEPVAWTADGPQMADPTLRPAR